MNWNLWNSAFSMNLSIQAQHVEMLPGSPPTDAVHLWGLTVPLACTRPRLAMQVGVHAVLGGHEWVAKKEYSYSVVLNVLHVLWYVMNMSNHQPATATNCSFTDKRELPRYLPSCRSEQCQNMGKLELEMDALPMDSGQQTIVKVSHNWLKQTKCSESAPLLIHTLANMSIYIYTYICSCV